MTVETADCRFRSAKLEEASLLTELILRSKAYWGYSDKFMKQCQAALAISPELITADTFIVLEKQRRIIGFYSLRREEQTAELTDLFIEPEAIGCGYGKQLWHHAVETARSLTVKQLLIKSDPNALGFYQAMGAKQVGEAPSVVQAGRMLPVLQFAIA